MKREFDFYEFTGVLLPGVIGLFGVSILFPEIRSFIWCKEFSLGDFGIAVLLSYAGGQILQALGNVIESIWWKFIGGMPSDWVRTSKRFLISEEQTELLEKILPSVLGINLSKPIKELDKNRWFSITRQMYAAIEKAERAKRVDIFNGNYGLNRGIASALLFVLALCIIYFGTTLWQIEIWLLLGFGVALYRMHRFGRHYARELFVQFLQLR